jgi:S-DNA-T family DNA segregation ATPase FtsK/SpoIIIE
MTDISPESSPGGPGDERIPDDLSSLFDDPAQRDRLESAARDAVRGTRSGMTDATTGTAGEIPVPTPETAAAGLIFDDADEGQKEGAATSGEPTGTTWTWKDAFPTGTFDSAVWAHRNQVFLHRLAHHAGHSHVYAWRLSKLSGLGVAAGARDSWHYYTAQEYADMVDTARRKKMTPDMIAALREERTETARARRREPLLVGSTTAVFTVIAGAVAVADVYGLLAASPAAVLTLGILSAMGLREHKRRNPDEALSAVFAMPYGTGPGVPLTDALINQVLRTAKVFTKDEQVITLTEPIRPAEIKGVEAKFKLPDEVTISHVLAKREEIAAALDIETHWLDIQKDGSPSRVSFWYCTSDPFGEPRVSPLVDEPERTDVWKRGILIGFNRRGLPIYLKLRHVMALLGGMSRTGKGMILRNLICGLGLDPRVNLRLVAGAKPGEHRGYAPICSTFFGRRPERLIVLLDALLAEAYRREDYLEEQGRAKLGEKDLDLFPLEILIIDEYKQYAASSMRVPDYSDPDGKRTIKAADKIAEQLEELAAFAAALNITVLVSTQDPDANTIPRGYKSNSGARVATRTGGPVQTNAILKDGATGAGLRAHDIPESLKGGAIVDIDGAPGEIIRGFFIEDEDYDGAADIIGAGRALREELGRAPGQFADAVEQYLVDVTGATSVAGGPAGSGRPGPKSDTAVLETTTVLTHLLDAFAKASNPDRLRTADLLPILANLDPYTFSYEALGIDEDADGAKAAYNRQGGRKLAEEIAKALDGTDRELVAREWTVAPRGRGYLLEEVRTAAGIAPE